MKRFRNLKIFGLVAILTFALVFIGINFVQGQVKTKGKPDKPSKPDKPQGKDKWEDPYVWSAVLLKAPENGQFSIEGRIEGNMVPNHTIEVEGEQREGWLYDSSEGNINVSGSGWPGWRSRDPNQVRSYFDLEIFYPVLDETWYQIDFIEENIDNQTAYFEDNPPPVDQDLNPFLGYKYLGFPSSGETIEWQWWETVTETFEKFLDANPSLDPMGIFDFLQDYDHPYGPGEEEDYYKVRFYFSSIFFDNRDEGTYDNWAIGDIEANRKDMRWEYVDPETGEYSHSGYGGFSIEGQNMERRHCDHGDYDVWNNHNINNIIWEGWPGYMVRIDEDIWKVVVDSGYVEHGDINIGDINIYEDYVECVAWRYITKGPIRDWLTVMRPTSGSCRMKFEMLFIRTPK